MAAHTITTIYYLYTRDKGHQAAVTAITRLLQIFRVVAVGDTEFQRALALDLSDFEDAVQAVAALSAGADYLVTRNLRDFRGVPVDIRAPGEVLALL